MRLFILLFFSLGFVACDSAPRSPFDGPDDDPDRPPAATLCTLPDEQIVSGGPGKDGIPALTNPATIDAGDATYLAESDRIIGLIFEGEPLAIPHNVLWWHEIVNYNFPSARLAVTYCPLTGSSIVFDRANIGDAELGVSGLLYNNNLIMYDRNTDEALWSQMLSGAGCNSSKETALATRAHIEMTWAGWKALYPDTKVLSPSTGHTRDYSRYPYGDYERLDNSNLLFPQLPWDQRRLPKERALGIPLVEGEGIVFPFGELDALGAMAAVETFYNETDYLILWDRGKQAATAFYPMTTDGEAVRIVSENEILVDATTGSEWGVDGLARTGAMAGKRLQPVEEAYVAFWFAWATFHPNLELYTRSSAKAL